MDRNEYESRIRALDQRLESSFEVLRAAHRVERRALDYLWMTSPGNAEAAAPPAGFPSEALPPPAALPAPTAPPTPIIPAPPAAQAPRPRRWLTSELTDRVLDLLGDMPEVFDRDDLLSHFRDNPPERSMLYRVLRQLAWDGLIKVEHQGGGRNPVRYRYVPDEDDATEG